MSYNDLSVLVYTTATKDRENATFFFSNSRQFIFKEIVKKNPVQHTFYSVVPPVSYLCRTKQKLSVRSITKYPTFNRI